MHNLQIIDSIEGGFFGFDRNDYPIDEGIYTELYCDLFSTESAQWCLDNAFETNSFLITSKTGIALKNNASTNENSINLIKKAVNDDLKRFTNKNPNIEIKAVEVAYYSKTIAILIEITGFNDSFNYIYNKTNESLENANFKIY